ncbi:MAG: hypothetical protein N2690_01350 [Rhodocyclaceae bacterium]|nr:hypothetical protein [Rhodocyclaceae bacterium]
MIDTKTENLARLLAAKAGVCLELCATGTFCTDGKVIRLPKDMLDVLENVCDGNRAKFRSAFLGVIAHEAGGHIQYSDFDVQAGSPLGRSILNLLEDIRIEKMLPLSLPGSRKHLETLAQVVSQKYWQPCFNAIESAVYWLMRKLRMEFLGQALDPWVLDRFERNLQESGMSAPAQQAYEVAVQALVKASRTADLLQAAQTILELLLSPLPSQATQGPDQSAEPADNTEQANSQQQQVADGQGSNGSDGDAKDNRACCGAGAPQGAEQSCSAKASNADPSGVQGINQADASTQPCHVIDARELQCIETDLIEAFYPVQRKADHRHNTSICFTGQTASLQERLEAQKVGNIVLPALREALRKQVEDEGDRPSHCGRLDRRAMWQIALPTPKPIFVEPGLTAPGIDAHVFLAIDVSGSMQNLMGIVRTCAAAVVHAAAQVEGCSVTVAAYNGKCLVLGTGLQALPKIAELDSSGTTIWLKAFDAAKAFLAVSRHRKKVMVTITDGDLEANHQVIQQSEGLGIEHLVIGIDTRPNQIAGIDPSRIAIYWSSQPIILLGRTIAKTMAKALSSA